LTAACAPNLPALVALRPKTTRALHRTDRECTSVSWEDLFYPEAQQRVYQFLRGSIMVPTWNQE
jgi:hypothetical protein